MPNGHIYFEKPLGANSYHKKILFLYFQSKDLARYENFRDLHDLSEEGMLP